MFQSGGEPSGSNHTMVQCASCGLGGVILQGSGGAEWTLVGSLYVCQKKVCQDKAKDPTKLTRKTLYL